MIRWCEFPGCDHAATWQTPRWKAFCGLHGPETICNQGLTNPAESGKMKP